MLAMDGNDKLAVIVAADAIGAIAPSWDHPPIGEINAIWSVTEGKRFMEWFSPGGNKIHLRAPRGSESAGL